MAMQSHGLGLSGAAGHAARHPRAVSQRGLVETAIATGALLDVLFGGHDGESFAPVHRNEALAVIREFERLGYPVQGPHRVVRP